MSHSDEIALMAHLMRRAGFGADRDELERLADQGYEATVEQFVDPPASVPRADEEELLRYMPSLGTGGPVHGPGGGQLAVPPGEHGAPARGEDGAVLAPRLRHRQLEGRQRQPPHHPGRDVPRARHGQLSRAAGPHRPEPGDDLLAGQPGEPQALAERELGPGAAGAVLAGRGPLHGDGRLRVRARLHRLDDWGQDPPPAAPSLLLVLRVPARGARLRREDLPGPHRPVRRRRHHRHHPPAARLPPLHRAAPVQLLRGRRGAGAGLVDHAAARSGGDRSAGADLRRLGLRSQAGAARAVPVGLLQRGAVRAGQEPGGGGGRHAAPDRRVGPPRSAPAGRRAGVGLHGPEPAQPAQRRGLADGPRLDQQRLGGEPDQLRRQARGRHHAARRPAHRRAGGRLERDVADAGGAGR